MIKRARVFNSNEVNNGTDVFVPNIRIGNDLGNGLNPKIDSIAGWDSLPLDHLYGNNSIDKSYAEENIVEDISTGQFPFTNNGAQRINYSNSFQNHCYYVSTVLYVNNVYKFNGGENSDVCFRDDENILYTSGQSLKLMTESGGYSIYGTATLLNVVGYTFNSITWNGSFYIATCKSGEAIMRIYTSPDSITWTLMFEKDLTSIGEIFLTTRSYLPFFGSNNSDIYYNRRNGSDYHLYKTTDGGTDETLVNILPSTNPYIGNGVCFIDGKYYRDGVILGGMSVTDSTGETFTTFSNFIVTDKRQFISSGYDFIAYNYNGSQEKIVVSGYDLTSQSFTILQEVFGIKDTSSLYNVYSKNNSSSNFSIYSLFDLAQKEYPLNNTPQQIDSIMSVKLQTDNLGLTFLHFNYDDVQESYSPVILTTSNYNIIELYLKFRETNINNREVFFGLMFADSNGYPRKEIVPTSSSSRNSIGFYLILRMISTGLTLSPRVIIDFDNNQITSFNTEFSSELKLDRIIDRNIFALYRFNVNNPSKYRMGFFEEKLDGSIDYGNPIKQGLYNGGHSSYLLNKYLLKSFINNGLYSSQDSEKQILEWTVKQYNTL